MSRDLAEPGRQGREPRAARLVRPGSEGQTKNDRQKSPPSARTGGRWGRICGRNMTKQYGAAFSFNTWLPVTALSVLRGDPRGQMPMCQCEARQIYTSSPSNLPFLSTNKKQYSASHSEDAFFSQLLPNISFLKHVLENLQLHREYSPKDCHFLHGDTWYLHLR